MNNFAVCISRVIWCQPLDSSAISTMRLRATIQLVTEQVKVSDTPGAENPHFRDLQMIANDVRKAEKA